MEPRYAMTEDGPRRIAEGDYDIPLGDMVDEDDDVPRLIRWHNEAAEMGFNPVNAERLSFLRWMVRGARISRHEQ
jgi:hypothetical protein